MAVSINANVSALSVQRRLGENTARLNKGFERLSSGMRINRAADDAAGLSIADALRTDIRVYNQGRRNISDGVSLLSVTEGAVNELKNIFFRLRELATQASSGVYSASQREALNAEARSLGDEYNRIIKEASFNRRAVFEDSSLSLQAGYGSADAIRLAADMTFDASAALMVGSTDASGSILSGASNAGEVSQDGRYLFFHSTATLTSNDTDGAYDVYRKDLLTGETLLVSSNSNGIQTPGYCAMNAISADGRYVVLESWANDLAAEDSDGQRDLFLKDLVTGTTKLITTDSAGRNTANDCLLGRISNDGRYITFTAGDGTLVEGDNNGVNDTFVKDMVTGTVTRVSTSTSGAQANAASAYSSISADGRIVAFTSSASNLVANDTNGVDDVFMRDMITGETTRISTSASGDQGAGISHTVRITADGRYATFTSGANNLVAGDSAYMDVFRKDLRTGEVIRISTTSSGAQANNHSEYATLSADGRFAAFNSWSTNFATGDNNGFADIFIKDLLTGFITRVNLNAAGQEATGGDSVRPFMSADGRSVGFYSAATNLVQGDGNGAFDSFMAVNPLADRFAISSMHSITLRTQSGAQFMQTVFDRYLQELNSYQGEIGAAQQRLSVANSVLATMNENNSAAESRIRDADIAEETATLTRANILQQAATAVLAQTSAQPSLALQLLKS